MEYKHYIRVRNGLVIQGFTTAFEQPQEGDILLTGQDGRHFSLTLTNDRGQYLYKILQGSMVYRTPSELDAEWNALPPPPKSAEEHMVELEQLVADLAAITLGV